MIESPHLSTSNGVSRPDNSDRVGLICGGGRFPMMVAEGARRAGKHVVALGIHGFADPQLAGFADEFYWTGVLKVGRWVRMLKQRGCTRVILAGAVRKADVHGEPSILEFRPDWATLSLWFKLPDYKSDTLLTTVADYLTKSGLTVEECTKYTRDAMAPDGYLTSIRMNPSQLKDVEFGCQVARELGRFDIGQSVAVKDQDIIAVEAVEGTDCMMQRAGRLCASGGWSLVKVSKPNQDMRFDVPTVGPATIETLRANRGSVLCVEADRTLIVDPPAVIKLAEDYGIPVLGRRC